MFGLSAIECFVAIVAIFAMLYWITPRKYAWFPMLVTVILLSVLAYYVIPNDSDDLNRYFMQLDYLRDYGKEYLDRCIKDNVNGSNWGTYRMCGYYFYLLSKFPNDHWMPAVTIFIVYSLMFLVIYKSSQRFCISKKNLFFGSIFFLSTYWYYDTLSGIRNGLTFAIIIACAYYHLVERKRFVFCFTGYVIACLIHSSGIMIVALVILTEITLNNSGKFMNFLLIFGIIGGGALVQFVATQTDNSFINAIAGQVETHANTDGFYGDTIFLVNISILIFVAFFVVYYSRYLLNSEYTAEIKRFYKFSSIIVYFSIGSLTSVLIFMRITRWIIPVIGSVMYMLGAQFQEKYIQVNGESYLQYYAPLSDSIRYKSKSFTRIIFVLYTAVHFWYLINGSSVHWMHF